MTTFYVSVGLVAYFLILTILLVSYHAIRSVKNRLEEELD